MKTQQLDCGRIDDAVLASVWGLVLTRFFLLSSSEFSQRLRDDTHGTLDDFAGKSTTSLKSARIAAASVIAWC
jgi:hypothetical protein